VNHLLSGFSELKGGRRKQSTKTDPEIESNTSAHKVSRVEEMRIRAGIGRVLSGRPKTAFQSFEALLFSRLLASLPLLVLTMSTHHFDANHSEKDPVWEGNETIWHAWEPECDACGRPQSSLKRPNDQLLSCAGCIVAKYCSVRSGLSH
jgi:hypothetical protein